MRRFFIYIFTIFFIISCGSSNKDSLTKQKNNYFVHKNIMATLFWIGEKGSVENKNIPNKSSVWDDIWMLHYGGVDDPNKREDFHPSDFRPFENPFYVALPFNDFDSNGSKKRDLSTFIPWAKDTNSTNSICKNRWIKLSYKGKTAYAQWEDAGPFGEDDKEYVFGSKKPKNTINFHAGIDLSPALFDYLNLKDNDYLEWSFVDEDDVENGPWKKIITKTPITWVNWYKPDLNISWQWQLQGKLNSSYDVKLYDIDLFDYSKEDIKALHKDGKKVMCYFSAGSYESFREDASSFPKNSLGKTLEGWEDERWLDIKDKRIWEIMKKRISLAKSKGCDAIEPDNIMSYEEDSGFNITKEDQLIYNKNLAIWAKEQSLTIALKNDLLQVKELLPFFDLALNESCHKYQECELLIPFIKSKKPVLNVEYDDKYIQNKNHERDKLCESSKALGLKTLILPLELDDSFRFSCD